MLTPSAPLASAAIEQRGRGSKGVWLVALFLILAALVVVSIAVGSRFIPPETAWRVLWHSDDSQDSLVVHGLRLPRTMLGIVAGVALGVAGALIMALTRNPLADPGVLGVNSGAHLAVALSISLLGFSSFTQYVWFAFVGAIVAALVVYLIGSAGRSGATPVRLTLAGVAFGAVLSGIATAVTLVDQRTFDLLRDWNAGSLVNRDPGLILQLLPFVVTGVVIALVLARALNAVALGDEMARGLGISVRSTRIWGVIAVTLLCGATTAVVGPISFVGLMVPHAVRWLAGPDQRWIVLLTVIASPSLLLAADILGRVLVIPDEMPVGVVVALVGGPVLIALVRRKRVSAL
ncbi:iron complex transport system permease protein [Agreia bicolorata]|uniref:Iron complex transport system permease protein n=1 Tax=Agreia bicolorata TaxID=110935 RepID=A0A1T4Y9R0_9MICO|nr:iron chelate uptake ABC transporter family permease subunit [Agreia bicolorata]SKA98433.1 iron complex transport system permease protein [Agreia bicolorata]